MITVDLFAGGGGASLGLEFATGRPVHLAVNHCQAAIAMHARNHPSTVHMCESIHTVNPVQACAGNRPDVMWASPDCKHFSRAKGGKPLNREIRALAWVVCEWAEAVLPRVICMENVREFETWGPLDANGRIIEPRKGETFREFVQRLRRLGYVVEWRLLKAHEYGAPTTRERLVLVARRDGLPIRWPTPTHGPGLLPYRTAAECIDWSIPSLSIFATRDQAKAWRRAVGADGTPKRPLADNTMARIAAGVRKYVIDNPSPFIVPMRGTSPSHRSVHSIDAPLSTISAQGNHHALVVPHLVNTRNGERRGQEPRTRDILRPLGTVTAQGSQGALAMAWMVKHYGGVVGHGLRRPIGTVTAVDHHAVGVAELRKGVQPDGRRVAAFLQTYNGCSIGGDMRAPMGTVTANDRFGLVTVELGGEPWTIVDVTMRMLQPRELARAQGFPDTYELTGTKREQVARIGNSVCPPLAEAVVRAQLGAGTAGRMTLTGEPGRCMLRLAPHHEPGARETRCTTTRTPGPPKALFFRETLTAIALLLGLAACFAANACLDTYVVSTMQGAP